MRERPKHGFGKGLVRSVAAIGFCLVAMVLVTVALLSSTTLAADAGVAKSEQTDTRLSYAGSWSTFSTASASSGSYKRANTSGSSVTIPFKGTSLTWIATKGVTTGLADVSIDGRPAVTVDLAAPSATYQQKVWSTGVLADGYHTVRISWNERNIAGKYINVDAVEVAGALASTTRVEQTKS